MFRMSDGGPLIRQTNEEKIRQLAEVLREYYGSASGSKRKASDDDEEPISLLDFNFQQLKQPKIFNGVDVNGPRTLSSGKGLLRPSSNLGEIDVEKYTLDQIEGFNAQFELLNGIKHQEVDIPPNHISIRRPRDPHARSSSQRVGDFDHFYENAESIGISPRIQFAQTLRERQFDSSMPIRDSRVLSESRPLGDITHEESLLQNHNNVRSYMTQIGIINKSIAQGNTKTGEVEGGYAAMILTSIRRTIADNLVVLVRNIHAPRSEPFNEMDILNSMLHQQLGTIREIISVLEQKLGNPEFRTQQANKYRLRGVKPEAQGSDEYQAGFFTFEGVRSIKKGNITLNITSGELKMLKDIEWALFRVLNDADIQNQIIFEYKILMDTDLRFIPGPPRNRTSSTANQFPCMNSMYDALLQCRY